MKKIIVILLSSFLIISCTTQEEMADAYGNFEVDEITISAKATGELLSFEIQEGDQLISGQTIGVIDTTYLVIKKNQLQDNIAAMTAKQEAAKLNYSAMEQQQQLLQKEKKRITNLYSREAATEQQKDKIETEHQVTTTKLKALSREISALNSQKAALLDQLAEINQKIDDAVIVNPVAGTVLVKYKNLHEMTSVGRPLYKVADLKNMTLRVYISADQLDDVQLGQEVKVFIDKDAASSHELTGRVTWISSTAEFTPKNIQTKEVRIDQVYAVKISVANDGKIKNGMPGSVNF